MWSMVNFLKVSKFQKQILLFSFERQKPTKLFYDFFPKDLNWVKLKKKEIKSSVIFNTPELIYHNFFDSTYFRD